jgi:GT2 family glycosyltransferase
MKIQISVIIVNYNGLKYLKECFDSLYDKLQNTSFEIIVIDNNSSDGSCSFIKNHYPKVVLIESKENLGFAKGNNEAVKIAQGDYLLLINNDTIVMDDLLPVLTILKSDIKIGVVGIKMLNANKKYIPSAGTFPNIFNMFLMKKLLEINSEFKSGNFLKKKYEVDWLGGAFLMLTKAIYQEINGFNEDYFMYVEDVDFCKKIADKEYKRIYIPDYSYVHFVGFNSKKNPMLVKGYNIYLKKHLKGANKIIAIAALKINKFVKKCKSALKLD